MMRFCPSCKSERPVSEFVCEGILDGEQCGWELAGLPVRPIGWRPDEGGSALINAVCPNGHQIGVGDLLCPTCGADIPMPADGEHPIPPEPETSAPVIAAGWRLDRRLDTNSAVRERYVATRMQDGREAIFTLYAAGSEPDQDVYEVLRSLSRDHVPEIYETGRWDNRAFEATEDLQGGTLAECGLLPDDISTISVVLKELGGALHAFSEHGLRHRDLRPGAILVREKEPLDLVITSFGSARLSEFDLDIVSPLETTRYMAPEAVAGGVSAASDWWSLGMILLEQVTRGACFEGVNDQAFLIHVLTNGAPIPTTLDSRVAHLLRGLLALDRRERWGWTEVQSWIAGELPAAPAARGEGERTSGITLRLGQSSYKSPTAFALAAAETSNWDEARNLLSFGAISTWAQDAGFDEKIQTELRNIANMESVSDDIRLSLTLKSLNPAIPLVCRGDIVTPGWLLDHPDEGYALITGQVPDFLKRKDTEHWLFRLKTRAELIRERAQQLEVTVNEQDLQVYLLSTSRSRLLALWAERRRILPDTDHPGLISILERRGTSEEDLILLLSSDVSQFRTAEAILAEAAETAERAGVIGFDREIAASWIERPRREIYAEVEGRVSNFSRCGLERVDEWADQFRLERRLPISRIIALLAVPKDDWREPPNQIYVATLLEFFSRRITAAAMRGPLTRMLIGKTTARVDLYELGTDLRPSNRVLEHILLRNDQLFDLDPTSLNANPALERRIRTLHSHGTLYRRDTGIDGLYLGFPFLFMREARSSGPPKIAPILLWPIKIRPEVGAQGRISIGFDREREEVRLNPSFETLLGPQKAGALKDIMASLLGRPNITPSDVMDAFSEATTQVRSRTLGPLPTKDERVSFGQDQLVCAGALFHLAYFGQAVMEDLRQLKGRPPINTALETLLRLRTDSAAAPVEPVRELDRYFTAASDPSQEAAVMDARGNAGLVVEGPPGTGKSQTIVNMVCDAIGRGRSLLVICQKQAALEVVNKRLVAEGLASRIVMVNDVNKDRRAVIEGVREQLQTVFSQPNGGSWRQMRQMNSVRIEQLEGELDRHHSALHAEDPLTGLSYRQILGDLISLNASVRSPIDVPSLRRVFSEMPLGDVISMQEICGPLGRFWLPSEFEENPFAVLKAFGTDTATLEMFVSEFIFFIEAEKKRTTVIEQTPDAFFLEDEVPYTSWVSLAEGTFRSLTENARGDLSRWLPAGLCSESDTLNQCVGELGAITNALSALRDREPDRSTAVVVLLDDADLLQWCQVGENLHRPLKLFDRISIFRLLEKRRWRKWLLANMLETSAPMLDALRVEMGQRAWRHKITGILETLGEAPNDLTKQKSSQLLALVRGLEARISLVQAALKLLHAYPQPELAFAMARAATAAAFENLLERQRQAISRSRARKVSLSALEDLEQWFEPHWCDARRSVICQDGSNANELAGLSAAASSVAAYQRFRPRASQLAPIILDIFKMLRVKAAALKLVPMIELDSELRRIIGREARLAWKARLEVAHPSLVFDADELQAKVEMLEEADTQMRKLNRKHLTEDVNLAALKPLSQWEDITRLTGPRSRRLREFVDRGADLGLMTLRPIWLVNPDVASRLLPLTKALFDTVIFDEASQMPIEYALPALFRARGVIVSGDEKQMPPTNFFSSKVENDEAQLYEGDEAEEPATEMEREDATETWNRREIKDCPDLLQLSKTVLPATTLKIHYRSVYRELIQYSNAAFYGGRLSVPARHPDAEIERAKPIELIRVDGIYSAQTNVAEAAKVVELLATHWRMPVKARKSIGVVTFNRKQADLIEEELEHYAENDSQFRIALTQERDRVEHGEDMGFFVKNVENVQGDERDLIIFSSTFGRNEQGTFRRTFGVLGQAGGERRLNVAITRARERVILITSMPISEISDLLTTRRYAASPRDFLQGYFEYARCISSGALDNARELLVRMAPHSDPAGVVRDTETDGFHIAVAKFIEHLGCQAEPILDPGAFGVDLALIDPISGLYGLGIECDAPRQPLLARARAREIWRPTVLRRTVGHVHRVSSKGWLDDPDAEKASLKRVVTNFLEGVYAL